VHLVIGLLFITGLLTGCAPDLAPLNQPIDAESALDYNRWLSNEKSSLSPLESHKFDRATDTINDRKVKSQIIFSDLPELSPSVGPEFWSPQSQNDLDLPATFVLGKCPHLPNLPTSSPL